LSRGYEEEKLVKLKLWSHRKRIPINWKDINSKRKFWEARRFAVRAQTVPSARTRCSCQNSEQTKLVREFGTGGFAPYRLSVPIYRHKKGGENVF
jgi:hypothetical protein